MYVPDIDLTVAQFGEHWLMPYALNTGTTEVIIITMTYKHICMYWCMDVDIYPRTLLFI